MRSILVLLVLVLFTPGADASCGQRRAARKAARAVPKTVAPVKATPTPISGCASGRCNPH